MFVGKFLTELHCHSWQQNTPQERREHATGDEKNKYKYKIQKKEKHRYKYKYTFTPDNGIRHKRGGNNAIMDSDKFKQGIL